MPRCFALAHILRGRSLQNSIGMRAIAPTARALQSRAKTAHWAVFARSFYPATCLRASYRGRARSRPPARVPPRVRPSLARGFLKKSLRKGFASRYAPHCAAFFGRPLRSFGLVARGRLRASAWLKTPARVPSALHPRALAPSGSPPARFLGLLRSERVGLSPRPAGRGSVCGASRPTRKECRRNTALKGKRS